MKLVHIFTIDINNANIGRNMIYYRFGTREIQILIVFDIAFNKKTTVDRLHVLLSMNAIFLFNSKCKW